MFNFHTYYIDEEPCLLNVEASAVATAPVGAMLSVGLHPWQVGASWQDEVARIRSVAASDAVWAIGECGLDRVHGETMPLQMEAFRAQIALSEQVQKPMVIHCVRAFDALLQLRKELEQQCHREGRNAQPWVVHGFRGKPEQAKQIMAKGLLLSFGHLYNVDTLRFVFTSCRPFYLETDDLHLSVRQIYAQVARHLGVEVARLDSLCDPRQTLFRHRAF